MKTIKDITIVDVQDLFDSVIFLRGEEYFEEDCVKSIEPANTNTITGIVRGNQNYNVTISIDSEDDNDEDYYKQFYLELYDKIGMNDKYVEIAKESGFNTILIDKLISLNRLDEALIECKKTKGFSEEIEDKKIVILRKLGDFNELKKTLLTLLKRTGEFNYAVKLKQQSSKEEWGKYFKDVAKDAKRKNILLWKLLIRCRSWNKKFLIAQNAEL